MIHTTVSGTVDFDMFHSKDRIVHTTAFVTPVVKH